MNKKRPELAGSGRGWEQKVISTNIVPLPPPRRKVRPCHGCGSWLRPLRPEHDLCRGCYRNHKARQALEAFRLWFSP